MIDKTTLRALNLRALAELEKPMPKITAIESLAAFNVELVGQLSILCDWLESHSHQYCKCENNGDYCEFHSMLYDAKESLK